MIRNELDRRTLRWGTALLLLLLALRLPSLAEPAGGDQGLYAYSGGRIMAGDVLYRDAWDQKPPGIAFLYGLMLQVWPHESLVAGADLIAAALVALLLVQLGRARFTLGIGFAAAALFLLLGDPYLHRLSGIYVRGQCEPFISLAITISLVLLARHRRARLHLLLAGAALAVAFWLKYNAAAYALPVAAAIWMWESSDTPGERPVAATIWTIAGFAIVSAIVLAYFTLNGALADLRLATIDYNLEYSQETYRGPVSMLSYLFAFPLERARVEMLWFLGLLGALLVWRRDRLAPAVVAVSWLAAAAISIAVNGSRDLPNYFVQADPPLALVASAGFATLRARPAALKAAIAALLVLALARVGAERPLMGLRLAGMPGLIENVAYDLQYVTGRMDRDTYLSRFKGQKHDVPEIKALVSYVLATTALTDPIFVFGFSGGSVCWQSHRVSSSRFFWSRPVIIEFAADRPGYGSAGLLEDLLARPPAVVALQKDEWGSREFFLGSPALRGWLQGGYSLDHETPMFSVWRRKPIGSGGGN